MIDVIYKDNEQEVYLATFTSLTNAEIFVDALIDSKPNTYNDENLAYKF